MGIFSWLSSPFQRKATDVSNYTWSELFPGFVKSGVNVNTWTALRVTTVLSCGRVLSEGVAQLPLGLFDIDIAKGTKTKNFTHPAYHLLTCEPNDWMTAFELREMMTLHAVLTGNAYAYLGWAGKGKDRRLVEIIPLMPSQVVVNRKTDYTMTYSVTDLAGSVTELSADAVLHLRGPSWDGYLGLDAIHMAREAIGLAIATEETHASLHANGAQPGGVLSVKSKLDDKARERLKQQWQNFQGGAGNRFKTAVLDMDAEWKALSMSGVDSQHLETRKHQIEEICRAMRVYPQKVMHSDKTSTHASAESFAIQFVNDCLMPWVIRWEQAINRTILGDDDNLICKLNVASMMRGDSAQRATFYQQALGGARPEAAWMTKNEVRELEDLNPIEGGDELPKPPPVPEPAAFGGGQESPKYIFLKGYDPNQPRDDNGRWGSGGAGVHATDAKAAKAVKDKWHAVSAAKLKSVDDVYKNVEANKAMLDKVGEQVASATHAKYKGGPIKKIERVLEKLTNNGKLPHQVNDIVRSTVYVDSPEQADSVVAALGKLLPVTDEGFAAKDTGYFDRALNVLFPNGQLGEVLIMPPQIGHAKDNGGHDLYSGERVLPKGHPLKQVLIAASNEHYRRAHQSLEPSWTKTLAHIGLTLLS